MTERSLFLAVLLEIADPAERAAYLERACGGDPVLRGQVEQLLKAHQESGPFMERPALARVATTPEPVSEGPGTVIGPYKLLEQIGEGGFGVVFMAEQQQPLRRRVALKVIKPGMDTHQVIARFEAERQALALMDHPNIAQVLDAGSTTSGRPYFVMELVRGVPITDYCDQNNLTPHERLKLFVSVCQAVQHAHQKGIIHRDLKPSNVLVTLHDGVPVVKVIDFGIAKATGQRLTEKTLFTNFAQMIGTPLYMSPEQAEMSGLDVDTRSDIYSLGVLLYELLTGTTPLDKERLKQVSFDELRRIVREEEPPNPSARISTLGQAATVVSAHRKTDAKRLIQLVRGDLDWIVMKALEKDRSRRYETASAFAADVQHHLRDEPVEARPPAALYRFHKFARRNKAALLVTAGAFLAVTVLGGSIAWVMLGSAAQEAARERSVDAIVRQATLLMKQGKWTEAELAVQRGEGLLEREGNAEFPERFRALRKHLDMVARVVEIRSPQGLPEATDYDLAIKDRKYGEAFRDYGIDVSALEPEEAAERLRATPIAAVLAATLDDWAVTSRRRWGVGDSRWKRLLAVARATDPDPWRNRFRDGLERSDRKNLERLAASKEVAALPATSLYMLGRQHREEGATKQAVAVLQDARRRYPDDFWINLELGRSLSEMQPPRWGEASRYYTAAVALRPQSAAAHNNLGIVLGKQGALDEAVAEFHQASRLDATSYLVHYNLGNALAEGGRHEEAIASYRKAIEMNPDFGGAYHNLGIALYAKGRYEEAITSYQKAIQFGEGHARAYNNLGNALRQKGRPQEAIAAYRKAIEVQPDNALAYYNLGNALRKQNQFDEAIAVYSWAIALQPDWSEAHNSLGIALSRKNRQREAIIAFRKAIELKPRDAEAHSNLGIVLRLSGRLDEAIASFRKAIELKPDHAAPHGELAWLLATCSEPKLRDPDEAVRLAKKAVELAPKNPDNWRTLGVAHYRAGNGGAAVKALEKSMQLRKGGDSFDWFFLAMAHERVGEQAKAREYYDRAVAWMEKNKPQNAALRRYRTEAAELLGIEKPPMDKVKS
jgi:serine/threonine-protein kinase